MKKKEIEVMQDLFEDWVDSGVRRGDVAVGFIGEIGLNLLDSSYSRLSKPKFLEKLEQFSHTCVDNLIEYAEKSFDELQRELYERD